MKAQFIYNNHTIVVNKRISAFQLIVDGLVLAEEKNFFKVQNSDYDLIATLPNSTGYADEVKVTFRHGMFIDEVTVYYAGTEIGTAQLL